MIETGQQITLVKPPFDPLSLTYPSRRGFGEVQLKGLWNILCTAFRDSLVDGFGLQTRFESLGAEC